MAIIDGNVKEILDSIGDGILLIDRDYKIIFANTAMRKLCKQKEEDIINQKCHNFSHQCPLPCYSEGSSIICPYIEVFNSGKTISVTHSHIMPDNTEKVFEITASPIRDKKGNVIQMIEILRDVTEKKRIEETLKETEEKFNALVEHSLAGVYLIQDNIFKYVNPKLAEIFDYSPEELINKKGPKDLVLLEDWPIVRENLRKRINGEIESINYTFRGAKKNGESFYVEVLGTRTFYNKRPAVIGTLIDITNRIKREEELKKHEIFLSSVLEGIGDGVVIVDRDFKIISANSAYLKQIRSKLNEIIGKHCYEVSHHINRPCYLSGQECSVKNAFETGSGHRIIHTHFDKDNNPIYVETISYPIKDSSGNITSAVEMITDVTEKVRLENELKKRVKELEDFYEMAVGRELRMIELKEEIKRLKEELKRYKV
jgi:PAS domain S-box-containing protein